MFRQIRSLGIALVVAATGVLAVPVGGAHASNLMPVAYITPRPPASGVVPCIAGTDKAFSGEESFDAWVGWMDYTWRWPGGGAEGRDLVDVKVPCDFDGEIEVELTVNNGFYSDTDTVRMAANKPPTAVVSYNGERQGASRNHYIGAPLTLSAEFSSDPENTALKYEWTSSTDPIYGNPKRATTTVTCETERKIELELKVTDEAGLSSSTPFTVNCYKPVTASFDPAPAGEGKRWLVPLGTKITFQSFASKFSNVEWRTTGVPGVASTNRWFTRTFDQAGNYGVELTEDGPFGGHTRWSGYTVVAPPTVSVTPAPPGLTDRTTIVTGAKITFDGSGSRSSNGGGALTYQWRTTGTRDVVSKATSYTRSFDSPGLYGVQLTVTDELGQIATRWVGFNVVPAAPPVVKVTPAPADPTGRMKAKVGDTITFDGSGSTSPSGLGLTYAWRTTGLPGVVATTKSYTRKFDKAGLFGVELVVIDSSGQQAKRWVGLTVEP